MNEMVKTPSTQWLGYSPSLVLRCGSIVVDGFFIVVPIVYMGFVFGQCFVFFSQRERERERERELIAFVELCSCYNGMLVFCTLSSCCRGLIYSE